MKIAISCGGTGGHTYPGLALAEALRKKGHNVEIILAGRAIEASTTKDWHGTTFKTGARPGAKGLPFMASATLRTIFHFLRCRPNILVAMGSYTTTPPAIAALLLRIPTILHESNSVPGKATKFFARTAKAVATALPGMEKDFKCKTIVHTGMPLRNELIEQAKNFHCPAPTPFTIFITGGSQGATKLNELASEAIAELAIEKKISDISIVHQTGNQPETEKKAKAIYQKANINAQTSAYISDMGQAFKQATLVIARAGASTIAEITLFGRPSILIPLPSAKDNHQYLNGKHLENKGAAIIIKEDGDTKGKLKEAIHSLYANNAKLTEMANASRTLSPIDATDKLLTLIDQCTKES